MPLTIEEFGKTLLDSNDLDPVYVALYKLIENKTWKYDRVKRFMVAYWCLYHCGVASHLSEQKGAAFWDLLGKAARNEGDAPVPGGRWPRAKERRHWRGGQAERSYEELRKRYPNGPEQMIQTIYPTKVGGSLPFADISRTSQVHRGFGDWIAFKIGDMLDRVLGYPVVFDHKEVFMFKDPHKAAIMLWQHKGGYKAEVRPKDEAVAVHGVVEYLVEHFKDYKAPPAMDRPVGFQEVETILCKWKSHVRGHYPVYNDLREIREGCSDWMFDEGTRQFIDAMPKVPNK